MVHIYSITRYPLSSCLHNGVVGCGGEMVRLKTSDVCGQGNSMSIYIIPLLLQFSKCIFCVHFILFRRCRCFIHK